MSVDYNRSLFGEIDRLVKIKIKDKEYEVPDRLELLRVFQFLDFQIDYSKLCWNGSCHRCVVNFKTSEGSALNEALSCRQRCSEGMQIVKIPPTIKPGTST